MKELFLKHQTSILRFGGALMLIIGFAAYFWTTPKQGISENDRAAANVARMEAQSMGGSSSIPQKEKPSKSPFLKKYQDTQASQMRYALIIMMILGVGSLGYSFIRKQ